MAEQHIENVEQVEVEEKPKTRKVKRVSWHMIPQSQTGGPHGFGDPEDKSLREVEKTILIPNMMKDEIKRNYCKQSIVDFEKCAKETGYLMPFKCRKQRDVLRDCMELWLGKEELREQCTEKYLEKRTKYRLTGIAEPWKKKHSSI